MTRLLPIRVRLRCGLLFLGTLFLMGVLLPANAPAYVYWTSPGSVGRANLDGTGIDRDFSRQDVGFHWPFGALAVNGQHLYWTREEPPCLSCPYSTGTGAVARADLDGTGADQNFITPGVDIAIGGAIALSESHIYWFEGRASGVASPPHVAVIRRANLDGSGAETVVSGLNLVSIYGGLAVDREHLYWAHPLTGDVGRADLDGSNPDPDFFTAQAPWMGGLSHWVRELAVDDSHIYWSYTGGPIGRANLNGTDVEPTFIGSDPTGPLGPESVSASGIAVDAGHIYWTDRPGGGFSYTIGRADLDGNDIDRGFILTTPPLFGPRFIDVAVDALETPPPESCALDSPHLIEGTSGDDALNGTGMRDVVLAEAGDDSAVGRGAADCLYGGGDDDQLSGHGGGDSLFGGVGDDVLKGNIGPDSLFGNAGTDQLSGGKGHDEIRCGAGHDTVIASRGADLIAANCERVARG